MGNIKQWIPEMVTSERDPSPDVDRIESAYEINYPDGALSNIVAMDVWHHLACPEQALDEWHRALQHGGRVVLMEPGMSLLGFLIFGLIHHEPVGWFTKFLPKSKWSADDETYFAAQSSAHRHFVRKQFPELLQGWTVKTKRLPALAYLTTGGFSKPQIGPNWFAKLFRMLETPASFFPWIFSTRLLVVLEKISDKPKQPSFLR
jgi:SAM-dependent methyltransferase